MKKNIYYLVLAALFAQAELVFGMVGQNYDVIRECYGTVQGIDLATMLLYKDFRSLLFNFLDGDLLYVKSAGLTNKRMLEAYNNLPQKDKTKIEIQIMNCYVYYHTALKCADLSSDCKKLIEMREDRTINFLNPTKYLKYCRVPIAEAAYRYKEKGDSRDQEVARHLTLLGKGAINYPIWSRDWNDHSNPKTRDLLARHGWTCECLEQENPLQWWGKPEGKPKDWDVYLQLKKVDDSYIDYHPGSWCPIR
jgi:hypothetical protein